MLSPTFYVVIGVTGSGKSSIIESIRIREPEVIKLIIDDKVMMNQIYKKNVNSIINSNNFNPNSTRNEDLTKFTNSYFKSRKNTGCPGNYQLSTILTNQTSQNKFKKYSLSNRGCDREFDFELAKSIVEKKSIIYESAKFIPTWAFPYLDGYNIEIHFAFCNNMAILLQRNMGRGAKNTATYKTNRNKNPAPRFPKFDRNTIITNYIEYLDEVEKVIDSGKYKFHLWDTLQFPPREMGINELNNVYQYRNELKTEPNSLLTNALRPARINSRTINRPVNRLTQLSRPKQTFRKKNINKRIPWR
jgi:hypothetical protein